MRSLGRPDPAALRGRRASRSSALDSAAPSTLAVLAVSAQLLGAGERVLADSVAYVKQRKQFGREIGSYQAIKHALADVRIALDFARPLVFAAALGEISPSAAKVAAGDAAYLASRTGLQVHGAIGYTAELDLSIWLTKIRALVTAWGTPASTGRALLAGARLMEFAFSEEQQELAATRPLAAGQARRLAPRSGPRWPPRRATTSRSGRRSASRSAWPRWRSRRSTTAPGSRCSSR